MSYDRRKQAEQPDLQSLLDKQQAEIKKATEELRAITELAAGVDKLVSGLRNRANQVSNSLSTIEFYRMAAQVTLKKDLTERQK